MNHTLTVRDLLLPGEPLEPAEVLAGHGHLSNPVSWVASLRPYSPAFPRLRGGELALVAVEFMSRLDPPTTLADVVRQLTSRGAAGLAVRGPVDDHAIEVANASGLPLLTLVSDTPLPDIEQAIMRACALYQARREMQGPEEADSWVDDLLSGRISTQAEAESAGKRAGSRLAARYSVAYVGPGEEDHKGIAALHDRLERGGQGSSLRYFVRRWEDGLAVLAPQGSLDRAVSAVEEIGLPCGIGSEQPVADAPRSLAEARLAEIASALLSGGAPVHYVSMGADRLLVVLYRERPAELRGFVESVLGPLLSRAAESSVPLLSTLESFVVHGGRLRETASDIYVHRNTLAYRLDRAAEVLGVDLRDPQARLSIELALRALPLVRALEKGVQ